MVRQWVKIPIKVSQTGLWKKGNARNGRGVANSLFASALANLKKSFCPGKSKQSKVFVKLNLNCNFIIIKMIQQFLSFEKVVCKPHNLF